MRFVLLVAFIVPLLLPAQKCMLSMSEVDPFTGVSKRSTKPERFAYYNDKLLRSKLSVMRYDSAYYMMLSIPYRTAAHCLTSESYVMFKYDDGSVTKYPYKGKVECAPDNVVFAISKSDFLEKSVSLIRIHMEGNTLDMTCDHPEIVSQHFDCIDRY